MSHSDGDVDNGGRDACVGAKGKYGKSLQLLLNCSINLKLLFKKKKRLLKKKNSDIAQGSTFGSLSVAVSTPVP